NSASSPCMSSTSPDTPCFTTTRRSSPICLKSASRNSAACCGASDINTYLQEPSSLRCFKGRRVFLSSVCACRLRCRRLLVIRLGPAVYHKLLAEANDITHQPIDHESRRSAPQDVQHDYWHSDSHHSSLHRVG